MNDTRYVLDLTKPYNDLLAIGNQNFIWGNDLLMAEGESSFSYLNDHLGSPIRLVGETQEQPLAYDEFGVPMVETTQNSESLNNPFGFTGYMIDDVSGLYFAQARWYKPTSARFVSEDPIAHGFNWYIYAMCNPVQFIDPTGFAEYQTGGLELSPEFQHDSGFVYDPSVVATKADYIDWYKWGVFATGAKIAPWLRDASKMYQHYRSNTGTDVEIDYSKAYKEDKIIKSSIDNEVSQMMSYVNSTYAASGKTSFEIIGGLQGIRNGTSENWQKTIGAHYVYGHGVVTIDTKTRIATMIVTFYMEDIYNFNPGQFDIASGTPDDVNGKFAVLGWAKEFKTYGSLTQTFTWNLDDDCSTSNQQKGGSR